MTITAFNFNSDELERHSRSILLKEVGIEGLQRIKSGRVLVIGAGGLGFPVLSYLAGGGVGTLGIADFDEVQISNLPRQLLYQPSDTGKSKIEVAKDRVKQLNPAVEVKLFPEKITANNLSSLLNEFDIVVDAVDSTETKWMIHDTCLKYLRPLIHAGVVGLQGQILTIIPSMASSLCLRCFYPEPDIYEQRNCSEEGVLAPLCGVMGSLQAAETLRYFSLEDKMQLSFMSQMLHVNLERGQFHRLTPSTKPCPHRC